MPFQVKNICYPDAASALDGWRSQYPAPIDSTGKIATVKTSSVDVNGVITGVMSLSNNTTATITALQLQPCTADALNNTFDKYSQNDIIYYLALVLLFSLGFLSGKTNIP